MDSAAEKAQSSGCCIRRPMYRMRWQGPARVPVKTDRLDKVKGHLQGYQDVYEVGGYGEDETLETYEPFWFRTFRFIQLPHLYKGRAIDPETSGLRGNRISFEVKTHVEASDKDMKGIWEISERTLRRCMHETL